MLDKGDKLKVILVDDDSDDQMLFKEVFSEIKIGSSLDLFKNGLEFLNHLDKPDTVVPDLIFLDLNMPIMGGIETLEHVRRSHKYSNVPIAIYSTSNQEKDIENTLARGANIYITKPSDYNKLKRTLEDVLKIQWQYSTSHLKFENFVMVI